MTITYLKASSAQNFTTGIAGGTSVLQWVNPTYASNGDNAQYATATWSAGDGSESYLGLTGLSVVSGSGTSAIPDTNIIKSVQVLVNGFQSGDGNLLFTPALGTGNALNTYSIDAGLGSQTNTTLPSSDDGSYTSRTVTLGGVDGAPYGGVADRAWTGADFNNANFKFIFYAYGDGANAYALSVDDVTLVVTHVPPPNANTGWLNGSTAVGNIANPFGATSWANPTNATSINGAYSTITLAQFANANGLYVSNFGASVPTGATVTGIEIRTTGKSSNVNYNQFGGSEQLGFSNGSFYDYEKSTASSRFNSTTDVTKIDGTSTSFPGGTEISRAEVVASSFGIAYFIIQSSTAVTLSVDALQMRVHYYDPSITTVVNYAGTATNVAGSGTGTWAGLSDATGAPNSDGASINAAYVSDVSITPSDNPFLKLTNYGFSIPDSATILSVEATIARLANTGSAAGVTTDETVQLLIDGVGTGANNASAVAWSGNNTPWETITYGGDSWGNTLTPAIINDSDFGLQLRIQNGGSQTTSSYFNPTTNSIETGSGGLTWVNPTNVYSSNNSRATCTAPGGTTGNVATVFPYLNVAGWSPAIPAGATILAIEVSVECLQSGGSIGAVKLDTVQLTMGGTRVGTAKVGASNFTTTEGYQTFGNLTTDLWGLTPTVAQINSGFGVSIRVVGTTADTNRVANIDHIRFRVRYFLPGTTTARVDSVALKVAYTAPTGETVTVPKLSFAQSLYTPNVNAKEIVAVPKLSFAQSLYTPDVNAKDNVSVGKLNFAQTLYEPSVIEASIVYVDKLNFAQSLYAPDVNAKDNVSVGKLNFAQTLYAPTANAKDIVSVPKLSFLQTLYAPNVNAKDVVEVPKLSFSQTLYVPNVNAIEIVNVPKLSFSQTLYAPTANMKDVSVVEKLNFVQSLYAPAANLVDKVFVPKLAFAQTLYQPNANAKDVVLVEKLQFVQTLYAPDSNGAEVVSVDKLNFAQSLYTPNANAKEIVAVPKLSFSQSLYAPTLVDKVNAPKLSFSQTLYAPTAKDRVSVDKLQFIQTLYEPNVNAAEKVVVPKLNFVQTLSLPKIDETVVVDKLEFIQMLFDAGLPEKVVVDKLEFVQELYVPDVPTIIGVPKLQFTQTLRAPSIVIDTVPQIRSTISWVQWEWNEEGDSVLPVRHSHSGITFLSKRITGAKIHTIPLITGATIKLAGPADADEKEAA